MTRPGASEIYKILVPCALTAGAKHEIKIRLRLSDNRVTFEDACGRRTAGAHDALARSAARNTEELPAVLSCLPWVELLRETIRSGNDSRDSVDLGRCRTCAAIVPLWHNDCPFQVFDPAARPIHLVDRRALPFWERLIRVGRVR